MPFPTAISTNGLGCRDAFLMQYCLEEKLGSWGASACICVIKKQSLAFHNVKKCWVFLEATPAPCTTPAPTKSPCPEDWKLFNGSCYFISVNVRSWSDSQKFCKRNGGHLAIIHTPEEQVRTGESCASHCQIYLQNIRTSSNTDCPHLYVCVIKENRNY